MMEPYIFKDISILCLLLFSTVLFFIITLKELIKNINNLYLNNY